jgi:hypothetical protein
MSNANASTDDNKLGGMKKMSNVNASASADDNKLGGRRPTPDPPVPHRLRLRMTSAHFRICRSLGCRTLPKMESEMLVRRNMRTARTKRETLLQ